MKPMNGAYCTLLGGFISIKCRAPPGCVLGESIGIYQNKQPANGEIPKLAAFLFLNS